MKRGVCIPTEVFADILPYPLTISKLEAALFAIDMGTMSTPALPRAYIWGSWGRVLDFKVFCFGGYVLYLTAAMAPVSKSTCMTGAYALGG